jgi:hypothetical protein
VLLAAIYFPPMAATLTSETDGAKAIPSVLLPVRRAAAAVSADIGVTILRDYSRY